MTPADDDAPSGRATDRGNAALDDRGPRDVRPDRRASTTR